MKKYTKKYFDFFGIAHFPDGGHDYVKCELCDKEAVDIAHIIPRGRGGSDDIVNLMAMCRKCHDETEGRSILKLQEIHRKIIGEKPYQVDYEKKK